MPMPSLRCSSLLLAALLLSGCASAQGTWVELKGRRIPVEIADDPEERGRGLMFRDSLPTGHGMLFIHDSPAPQAYWMKNTRIPLDILYFNERLQLVSVQRNVPPCRLGDRCPSYPSVGPAQYVLELNAGEAQTLGVAQGDVLRIADTIAR